MLHGGGARALAYGRRHGLPVLAGARGVDVQTVPEIAYGATLDPRQADVVRHVATCADRVVAPSALTRDMLLALGAAPERIAVIPVGVDYEVIRDTPFTDRRAELGLLPEHFVIVTVGRNSAIKRIELLYAALALVRRELPEVRCVSVGPGDGLSGLAERCGVGHLVITPGSVPASGEPFSEPPFARLLDYYRSADLYASVSFVESFGAAAADALACGTPVLVGARHGVRDVVDEERSGFVFEGDDPGAVAERIFEAARRRTELAAARPRIAASAAPLSWQRIAVRFRDLCLEMLG
jgi:D-inositol-3-phosphate glycosyltransferase